MRCHRVVLLGVVFWLLMGRVSGGTELFVMMGLGEVGWWIMRERIFPPFEKRHGVAIRGIQAEAGDAFKKLVAMHRAGRMQVDLITQDVLLLSPLVSAGVMEDLSSYVGEIPATALPPISSRWEASMALSFSCPIVPTSSLFSLSLCSSSPESEDLGEMVSGVPFSAHDSLGAHPPQSQHAGFAAPGLGSPSLIHAP